HTSGTWRLLSQQEVLDDALEHLVEAPEIEADDDAGDQDDCGARDHLLLVRPVDLLQLAPGLGEEAARAGARKRARLRRLGTRLGDRPAHPLPGRRARAVHCLRPAGAALLPGLTGH